MGRSSTTTYCLERNVGCISPHRRHFHPETNHPLPGRDARIRNPSRIQAQPLRFPNLWRPFWRCEASVEERSGGTRPVRRCFQGGEPFDQGLEPQRIRTDENTLAHPVAAGTQSDDLIVVRRVSGQTVPAITIVSATRVEVVPHSRMKCDASYSDVRTVYPFAL